MIVGIVGTGVMGRQIARLLAQKNIPVLLCGRSAESLANAQRANRAELERAHDRRGLSEREAIAIASSIVWTRHLDDLGGCELVLECIVEDELAKRQLIEALDQRLRDTSIIASNTSSIPIGTLATGALRFPWRVVGLHFVNPAEIFGVVELIASSQTAPEVVVRARRFLELAGKIPIEAPDTPGFIINRVLFGGLAAALELVDEGADPLAIDQAMAPFHRGGKMGPLKVADFIGLDVVAGILEQMDRNEGRWRPQPMTGRLAELIAAGKLGRKTGEGFFTYGKGEQHR